MSELDTPSRDLSLLAPKFAAVVEAAIADCAGKGLPVKVNEGFRSQARQSYLYEQGRSRPGDKVTNAPTSLTSWHGYGLAVDVIHQTKAYWPFGQDAAHAAQNEDWFRQVAQVFKAHDCSWGGGWKKPDTPHMQWGRCPDSPTAHFQELFQASGKEAVWRELGADGDAAPPQPVPWMTYQGTPVVRIGTAYSYVTGRVAIDADGSPRAYHPNDTGLDALANAGYPDKGWRSVLVVDPNDASKPFVQPDGPTMGYFVSKTSLQDSTLKETDPRRYVDAETVPYVIFPGAFYATAGTGRWGDLVMARNLDQPGRETLAVVADGGPTDDPLGEMSIALATRLGGTDPNPRNGAGAPTGRMQYVVFPGSHATPPWRRDLAEMETAAKALLAQIGGWPAA